MVGLSIVVVVVMVVVVVVVVVVIIVVWCLNVTHCSCRVPKQMIGCRFLTLNI